MNSASGLNLAEKRIPLSFETRRLSVRRMMLDDDQAFFEAARASVREVYPFLAWCHPDYDISETREWLAGILPSWRNGDSYGLGIFDKATGAVMGGCGLNAIDEENGVANLGYWVKSTVTSKGIASEAVRGLARWGFAHLNLKRIEIVMAVHNEASRKVAEKAGATFEGRLRNGLTLHGRVHDAFLYSLIPSDDGYALTGEPAAPIPNLI